VRSRKSGWFWKVKESDILWIVELKETTEKLGNGMSGGIEIFRPRQIFALIG